MRDFRKLQAGIKSRPVSRRSLVRGATVAGMTASLGAYAARAQEATPATPVMTTPTVDISGTSLSILQ